MISKNKWKHSSLVFTLLLPVDMSTIQGPECKIWKIRKMKYSQVLPVLGMPVRKGSILERKSEEREPRHTVNKNRRLGIDLVMGT